MRNLLLIPAVSFLAVGAVPAAERSQDDGVVVLLEDDFHQYPSGQLLGVVGAHSEYHFLPETALKGNWAVSTYRSDPESQRAWRVVREEGQSAMAQVYTNRRKHTHPMIVAGDEFWSDYTVIVRFAPASRDGECGLAFRYRNDRCYYFFGLEGSSAVLKMVRHEEKFHKLLEKTLARRAVTRTPGEYQTATVSVKGEAIRAELGKGVVLEAQDATYPMGKVALISDSPARFAHVRVTAAPEVGRAIAERIGKREQELRELQAANPKPVVWKKAAISDFGVGRNLRFGDLNGDGRLEVLIGQVLNHGPKDTNSEISCLTAMTFDGQVLWQIGRADPWKNHLTSDVAFQIHDLDGDGRNEVVYCMNMELVVGEGGTGKTKRKVPTPETPGNTKPPHNRFPRILGDSLLFCDLRGIGQARDLILKDRYQNVWAMNDRLEVLWFVQCTTGHYPFACDVDGDGRDEVAIGYSLLDHDGKFLWTLDNSMKDHADGVAIVKLGADPKTEMRWLCAGSDEGMILADLNGKILKHHRLGHVQNPGIADLRPDLPGLETVTVDFWGNQGIICLFDAEGNLYHDFEPFQHGSLCLPINWTGRPPEYYVLSANVEDGGVFDGWGRRVVVFPTDGHPDMCYAVLDVTGDCRDEVVVWDPYELWVYTQDDNPKQGRLYRPKRNPLCNYSNYQATVSLPGWSE